MSMWLKVINTGSQYGNCYALMSGDGEILLLYISIPFLVRFLYDFA